MPGPNPVVYGEDHPSRQLLAPRYPPEVRRNYLKGTIA